MITQADALNMPLADCSVDAIVTDPPYGLEFMGKEWDKLWDKRDGKLTDLGIQKQGDPFIGKNLSSYKAGLEAQLWHTQWLTEAYRVLKPGGSMLVMGGTRTFHRLMCAIEDSGFIIKDTLMWIYGSGFPKAQDLGKMIDKRGGAKRKVIGKNPYNSRRPHGNKWANAGFNNKNEEDITTPSTDLAKYWDGFKVGGIKPAYEPIVWAVKPPEGSYVDNVLKWGVGAVNVDECRIGLTDYDHEDYIPNRCGWKNGIEHKSKHKGHFGNTQNYEQQIINTKGRFPANIILDEESAKVMDEQSGNNASGKVRNVKEAYKGESNTGLLRGVSSFHNQHGDSGGASRFFYCAKSSRSERNAGLDNLQGENQRYQDGRGNSHECFEMEGCGRKTGTVNKNNHPTVKPIALFEWLIKLVTREGQAVLDPFLGSGTTAISAYNTGRKCIGIEKEGEYIEIAKRRVEYHESQPKQMEIGV